MVFELGQFARGGAERVSSLKVFSLVNNPAVVALVITVLVLIIVFACFGGEEPLGDTTWKQRARCALFIMVATGGILALHYYAFERQMRSVRRGGEARSLTGLIHGSQELPPELQERDDSRVHVYPKGVWTGGEGPAPSYLSRRPAGWRTDEAPGPGAEHRPPERLVNPSLPNTDDIKLEPLSFPLV